MGLKRSYQDLFAVGANRLAAMKTLEYGPDQQAAGFTREEWELLTDATCWTQAQYRQVASALANAVSMTLNIAGLAPTPLPGIFVAAVIVQLVAPCNVLLASRAAPASFDAISAVGIHQAVELVMTPQHQMDGLVTMFMAGDYSSLQGVRVDELVEKAALESQD